MLHSMLLRRTFYIITALGVAVACLQLATSLRYYGTKRSPAVDCPFCKADVIARQCYWEGTHCRALVNRLQLSPGASLIIPKRHVERMEDLSSEEWDEIRRIIPIVQEVFVKAYGVEDFVLALQNGSEAGQTVFHSHMHMLPRKELSAFQKLAFWVALLHDTVCGRGALTLQPSELEAQTIRFKVLLNESAKASH